MVKAVHMSQNRRRFCTKTDFMAIEALGVQGHVLLKVILVQGHLSSCSAVDQGFFISIFQNAKLACGPNYMNILEHVGIQW